MLSPLPNGRGGTKPYCGEMGSWGKRQGNCLGSFLSTGQWGPPSGGQGWVGGRLRDAVDHKNRTEGWRTGMVWEPDGYRGNNPVWPHFGKLDNIIIKGAKGGGSR